MPDNPILLQVIEDELLKALNEIVDGAGEDGKLMQVRVASFQSADDMRIMLDQFRDQMPGGFLSPPHVKFTEQQGVRPAVLDLRYLLLVGITQRTEQDQRRAFAYKLFQEICGAFFYKKITGVVFPEGADVDFIKPDTFVYAEGDSLGATLFEFSLSVRKWEPRTPDPR